MTLYNLWTFDEKKIFKRKRWRKNNLCATWLQMMTLFFVNLTANIQHLLFLCLQKETKFMLTGAKKKTQLKNINFKAKISSLTFIWNTEPKFNFRKLLLFQCIWLNYFKQYSHLKKYNYRLIWNINIHLHLNNNLTIWSPCYLRGYKKRNRSYSHMHSLFSHLNDERPEMVSNGNHSNCQPWFVLVFLLLFCSLPMQTTIYCNSNRAIFSQNVSLFILIVCMSLMRVLYIYTSHLSSLNRVTRMNYYSDQFNSLQCNLLNKVE